MKNGNKFYIRNYNIYRQDGGNMGGVVILIRRHLKRSLYL
jgi:hypothetical protein